MYAAMSKSGVIESCISIMKVFISISTYKLIFSPLEDLVNTGNGFSIKKKK